MEAQIPRTLPVVAKGRLVLGPKPLLKLLWRASRVPQLAWSEVL